LQDENISRIKKSVKRTVEETEHIRIRVYQKKKKKEFEKILGVHADRRRGRNVERRD